MMHFHVTALFVLNFFIRSSLTQMLPVVPLTNALTAVYCHHSDEPGMMTIRCGPNEKIRMLDAFDATVRNKSQLPVQCLTTKNSSVRDREDINGTDCKVHTSFTSACSGRENCTLHMQRIRLNSARDHCQNELVDYTMAFFECISDAFIHNVCSPQAITSPWGTLQTPNFPNPYTSNDDCWCKLSTQLQHRLLLSIVVFQLIPYDQHCAGAGLYLESSNDQRSTQCTYLQQGHNYLSDTNSLYINFYSRTPTVRGGFWMIYEASHPTAEVHLHCGTREKIGVPSWSTSSPNLGSSPPISTPFDHGWSRLAFNDPINPTTPLHDQMMRIRLTTPTPRSTMPVTSKINASTAIGAFTYPHGSLTTFELAYGPRGWYLKHPLHSSEKKFTTPVPTTTTPLPVVKWNLTWRYTRPFRTKSFTNRTLTKVTTATTKGTTTATAIVTTTAIGTASSTTEKIPATTTIVTEDRTIDFSTSPISTTTTRTATAHRRLLFTHKPWIYHSSSTARSLTAAMEQSSKTSTEPLPFSTAVMKATLPIATPWYSPAGPFDWWQWQWYTTKSRKAPKTISSTVTTQTTSATTTTSKTTTTSTPSTATTTVTSTTQRSSTTKTTTTTRTTSASTKTSTKTTATITTATKKITTTIKTETTSASTSTTSTAKVVTMDWFKLPFKEVADVKKNPPDNFDEEYKEWLAYLTTNEIQGIMTSTVTSGTALPLSPKQQQQQQGSNSLSTKSTWPSNHRVVVTVNTPPVKRQHSQQSPGVSERNAIAIPNNEQMAGANYHNMIRRVIEQRNKKNSLEYGWLSKTDMTIVAVSILFVVLLAIINLILYAVRRHRHRLQGRHLLSTSMPSTLEERRLGGNRHLHGGPPGDSTNSLINATNNSNNDILPAVGEIVIWDEKDQGGYMIDNNGTWAKIEGRQWFGSNIFKSCSKTSLSKSFRSRFRFTRHADKKGPSQPQAPATPKTPSAKQQIFKFPLMMDTATLSPVPEADDYESSELSLSDIVIRSSSTTLDNPNKRQQQQPLIKSERKHNLAIQNHQKTTKVVQALVHAEQSQSVNDDYYKRIGHVTEDSNYTTMPGTGAGESSTADQETDRSVGNEMDSGGPVVVRVPTMFRREDDTGTMTDTGESSYNHNYSLQSIAECPNYLKPNTTATNKAGTSATTKPSLSTFKPPTNHSIVVGRCQAEFQPLDPKLLFKPTDKLSFGEQTRACRSSQSVQLSTYDSGFVDEQGIGSLTVATTTGASGGSEPNLLNADQINMDDILLTKSEDDDDDDDDDDDLMLNGSSAIGKRNPSREKWKTVAKRVSFQEEHVVQCFSPPSPSFNASTNAETSSNLFETYDIAADLLETVPSVPSLTQLSLPVSHENTPAKTAGLFPVQKLAPAMNKMDQEDTTQTIIMDHLHSVQSLKKFFETKMVIQGPVPISSSSALVTTIAEQKSERSSIANEPKPMDRNEQRQEMMNKVLESMKRKKAYSRTTEDALDPSGRSSAMTHSSYESNLAQNLAIQRHYSRRFRSSSTSNNSLGRAANIITHINVAHSQQNKRALSQDRQHYQTTDHIMNHIDKWKQESQRQTESDDDDNISESSMLWQARTKLNEFVSRTRRNQQQSPYYSACMQAGTPTEDLYAFDDNESVTAETRF